MSLKDKYEISIWEYNHIPASGDNPAYFQEQKLAIIGADTMTEGFRATSPQMVMNVNGTNKFTFKMVTTYTDAEGEHKNPFLPYLTNERLIKVKWRDEWFDMVIKNCQEDSKGRINTYTCQDLHVNELSKTGFNLVLDEALGNNGGTAGELVGQVVAGTGWSFDEANSDKIWEEDEEAVIEVQLSTTALVDVVYSISFVGNTYSEDLLDLPLSTSEVLFFYKELFPYMEEARKAENEYKVIVPGDMIHFACAPNGQYETEDSSILVTNATIYYFDPDYTFALQYDNGAHKYSFGYYNGDEIFGGQDLKLSHNYRAKCPKNRQRTKWDPLSERYAKVFSKTVETESHDIYLYETTVYNDPTIVTNTIANSSNFTSSRCWTADNDNAFKVTSWPRLSSMTDLIESRTFLRICEEGKATEIKNRLQQSINFFKDGLQKGQKFIIRYKATIGVKENPSNTSQGRSLAYLDGSDNNNKLTIAIKDRTDTTSYLTPVGDTLKYYLNSHWVEQEYICSNSASQDDIRDKGLAFIISHSELSDNTKCYWLEAIEMFKKVEDEDGNIIYPDAQSISQSVKTTTVYTVYDKTNADNKGYTLISQVPKLYEGEDESEAIAAAGTPTMLGYQKYRTISAKQSNYFNILQSIAETFQCWIRFHIAHDLNGLMGARTITLHRNVGEEVGAGFVYGIDLNSIQRTVASDKIATKTIVNPNTNSAADHGYCDIGRAQSNPSGDSVIYNFEYYTDQGILDPAQVATDLDGYYNTIGPLNRSLRSMNEELANKQSELQKKQQFKHTYDELAAAAANQMADLRQDLLDITHKDNWTDVLAIIDDALSKAESELTDTERVLISRITKYVTAQKKCDTFKEESAKFSEDVAEEQFANLNYFSVMDKPVMEYGSGSVVSFMDMPGSDYWDGSRASIFGPGARENPNPISSPSPLLDGKMYGPYDMSVSSNSCVIMHITNRNNIPYTVYIPKSGRETANTNSMSDFLNTTDAITFPAGEVDAEGLMHDKVTDYVFQTGSNVTHKIIYFEEPDFTGFTIQYQSLPNLNINNEHDYTYQFQPASTDTYMIRFDEIGGEGVLDLTKFSLYIGEHNLDSPDLGSLNKKFFIEFEAGKTYDITVKKASGYQSQYSFELAILPKSNNNATEIEEKASVPLGAGRYTLSLQTTSNDVDNMYLYVLDASNGHYLIDGDLEQTKAKALPKTIELEESTKINVWLYGRGLLTGSARLQIQEGTKATNYCDSYYSPSIAGVTNDPTLIPETGQTPGYRIKGISVDELEWSSVPNETNRWKTTIEKDFGEANSANIQIVGETDVGSIMSVSSGKQELQISLEGKPVGKTLFYKLQTPYTVSPNLTTSIQNLKTQITNTSITKTTIDTAFQQKYSSFIQEGTWQSDKYADPELYFADAQSVSYTSSRPQVSYNISVMRVSSLPEFRNRVFKVGDISYIEDPTYFGYKADKVTPYREKVSITEYTANFDEPSKDSFKVQNYKTQFEDLFHRITASTQSLQFASGSYARAANAMATEGVIKEETINDSIKDNNGIQINGLNDAIKIDTTGLTLTDLASINHQSRVSANGFSITTDGGETWNDIVTAEGINANQITAGSIDTAKLTIRGNGGTDFRWDQVGISAIGPDNSSLVRLDERGLWGKVGGSIGNPYDKIEDTALYTDGTFMLGTWMDNQGYKTGFFLKNSVGDKIFQVDSSGVAEIAGWKIESNRIYQSTTVGTGNDHKTYTVSLYNIYHMEIPGGSYDLPGILFEIQTNSTTSKYFLTTDQVGQPTAGRMQGICLMTKIGNADWTPRSFAEYI